MPKPSKSASPPSVSRAGGTGATGGLPPLASLRVPPGDLVAYILVARLHQPLHRRLTDTLPWMPTEVAGPDVCELMRQDLRLAHGPSLVLVTSLLHTVPPLAVWRDYKRTGRERERDAHSLATA